jgi:hypothetical protein
MTVAQDQQIALDFFAVWEQQVKYFGLTILPEREDRLMFRKGKKLMESAIELTQPTKRVPFTLEEILPAWDEYLESYSDQGQVKVFDRNQASKGMDSRDNPVASAMGLHGQIVFYDNANSSIVKSFDRAGKLLKSLMLTYNKETNTQRFNIED